MRKPNYKKKKGQKGANLTGWAENEEKTALLGKKDQNKRGKSIYYGHRGGSRSLKSKPCAKNSDVFKQ